MKTLSALQSVNNFYAEINYFNEYKTNKKDYIYVKAVFNTETVNTYFNIIHSMLLMHFVNVYRVLDNHHQKEVIEKKLNQF